MEITGTITKLNTELNYGFINVPKLGDVFFSEETQFSNLTFNALKVDQRVQVDIATTERGLFAKSISELSKSTSARRQPETSL